MEIFILSMHYIPVHRVVWWSSQYLGVYEFSPLWTGNMPYKTPHPDSLAGMWRLGKPSDTVRKAIRKTLQPQFEVGMSLTGNVFFA